MLTIFLRNNKTLVSIILYFCIFGIFQLLKPSFLYDSNGSLRDFGIGYKNKTILPLWLFAIVLGLLCYLFVLFILTIL